MLPVGEQTTEVNMLDLFVPRWLQGAIVFAVMLWFFVEMLAVIVNHI